MTKEKLVFVRHKNPGFYLFSVPFDLDLFAGDRVYCETRRGIARSICVCDSFETELGHEIRKAAGITGNSSLRCIIRLPDEKTTGVRGLSLPPNEVDITFDDLF